MSKLYVLNPTNQRQQVYYRIDFALDEKGNRIEGRKLPPKYQIIEPGHQVQFGPEFMPTEVGDVIQQIEESNNAVCVDHIKTAKAKGVVRLVWALDTHITRPICEDVMAHNMDRLSDIGAKRRRAMAINTDYALREIFNDPQNELNGQQIGLVMEVESTGQEDPNYTAPRLAEGLKIQTPADAPEPQRGRRRAR